MGRIGEYWVIWKLAKGIEADFIAAINHFLGGHSSSSYSLKGHEIRPVISWSDLDGAKSSSFRNL